MALLRGAKVGREEGSHAPGGVLGDGTLGGADEKEGRGQGLVRVRMIRRSWIVALVWESACATQCPGPGVSVLRGRDSCGLREGLICCRGHKRI